MSHLQLLETLRNRMGWTKEYLDEINDPAHDKLMDIDLIAHYLKQIHDEGSQIIVLPDFDMDGITSGVVGFAGLAQLGFNAGLYRPRPEQGYGFVERDIDAIIDEFPDARSIITCDVGITAHDGIAYAKSKGLRVLITDHHRQLKVDPNADVIVDPVRLDETYSNPGICGAHVMYQVLSNYARIYDPEKIHDIDMLRLFAGIGTVSDLMPLIKENRALVRDSISIARLLMPTDPMQPEQSLMGSLLSGKHPTYRSAFEGFSITLSTFKSMGKLRTVDDLDEGFYGFYLAPTFNSIKRMDGSMSDAFGAFFAPNEDKVQHIANVIELNETRKAMVSEHMENLTHDVQHGLQPFAPYVYIDDIPGGIAGLIATKLMSQTGVPTVVVNGILDDEGNLVTGTLKGSGRSPAWFPYNTLGNEAGFWIAGHEGAFGIRINDMEQAEELYHFVHEHTMAQIAREGASDASDLSYETPTLRIASNDSVGGVDGSIFDLESLAVVAQVLNRYKPYGRKFAKPQIEVVLPLGELSVSVMGKQKQHMKISHYSGLDMLWWNQAPKYEGLMEAKAKNPETLMRAQGMFDTSEFRGKTTINFIIDTMSLD